ncbi:MAG: hypothetical protein FWG47_04650 [Propionibacteriaceae bacterium]|nr:hypothetical protein [Propionibacteriaceae bacterium]
MGLFRPEGPKSAKVYWVRRLIVLAPLAIAACILIWAFTSSGDEKPLVPTPTPTPTPSLQACNPATIDLSVAALQSVKAGAEKTSFAISFTNTSTQRCLVDITPDNFEVKIISGKDQIWTTATCAQWVPASSNPITANEKYVWSFDWELRRSNGCKLASAELKPGTYQILISWHTATTRKAFQIVK